MSKDSFESGFSEDVIGVIYSFLSYQDRCQFDSTSIQHQKEYSSWKDPVIRRLYETTSFPTPDDLHHASFRLNFDMDSIKYHDDCLSDLGKDKISIDNERKLACVYLMDHYVPWKQRKRVMMETLSFCDVYETYTHNHQICLQAHYKRALGNRAKVKHLEDLNRWKSQLEIALKNIGRV